MRKLSSNKSANNNSKEIAYWANSDNNFQHMHRGARRYINIWLVRNYVIPEV